MQRIKAKLNSKRGVSLMMALLLFLMCALSGAAAITAAGSNIGRYSYMRKYQQEYLSVSSAAKLLKTQFEQGTDKISADYSVSPAVDYGGLTSGNSHVYGLMEGEFFKLFSYVHEKKSGGSPSVYAPSEVSFDVMADGFKDVRVVLNQIKLDDECKNADMYVELFSGEHKLTFTVKFVLSYEETTQILKVASADVERITLPKS